MALVLLMIGLPIVTATAFMQGGLPGRTGDRHDESPTVHQVSPKRRSPFAGVLTWRNAIAGGVMALLLLIGAVVAYVAMWTLGIGSVGSLVAQGVLDTSDPILLAEFENRTDDASLGVIVTEALSVDLGESQAVTLLGSAVVGNTLSMMGRDPDERVTESVAQEVAVRENIKAVVAGEVSRVGTRYLLIARIVTPQDGETVISFREEASGDDDLLPAIDRLSGRLREKMGESLKTIRLGTPLQRATTFSLEALRRYTTAEAAEEEGDYPTALRLLDEAVALDTAFAMAYRKIGVLLFNQGSAQEDIDEAATLAYTYRDRLTELERHLAVANYHNTVTKDEDEVIRAYEGALTIDPNNGPALNNLSNVLGYRGQFAEALELLERAVSGPGVSSVAHWNNAAVRLFVGDLDGAVEAREEYESLYPGHIFVPWSRLMFAAWAEDSEEVHSAAQGVIEDGRTPFVEARVPHILASVDVLSGQVREALVHLASDQSAFGYGLASPHRIPLAALGKADIALWILDDTASVETGVAQVLNEAGFDEQPPADRAWAIPVVTLAQAGRAAVARVLYERWEREVAPEDLVPANRDVAYSMILLAEGDAQGALDLIERAAVTLRCSRCVEEFAAQIYEDLGRTAEAIETWERMRDSPMELVMAPWSRIVAMKRLGPLYEEMGDTVAAIAAYEAFADAWSGADPELQPQVSAARARIAVLGGG